jgi:hypothetical protein
MSAKALLGSIATAVVILAGVNAAAQSGSGTWEFTIAPYLAASGMEGAMTVKGVETDVDVPFDTILENLDLALMAHFDMKNDKWVLTSDITYVDLEASSDVADGTATATVQETLLEVTGGYRVSRAVTLFAGARWVDLGSGLRYAGPSGEGEAEVSKSWVDPIFGIHLIAPLSQRWWLGVHGDVGGFGVGSDLAWQAYADIGFRASDLVSVIAGYRAIDIDYQEGSGNDLFRYDMLIAGPQIGVAFRF